jgi:hypothetical protein
MRVLQFWSDTHRETPLDVFVHHPFDFEKEWQDALLQAPAPDAPPLRFATIASLIKMKRAAGRPRDLADIEFLERLQNDSSQ